MAEQTITAPAWALSTRLAEALGISSTRVLPMGDLEHLFDGSADFYIWPPAGQRTTIIAWLEARGCTWREHPGAADIIIARGADVQQALPEVSDEH